MLNKIVFLLSFRAWKYEEKKYEGKWEIENPCNAVHIPKVLSFILIHSLLLYFVCLLFYIL